MIYQAQDHCKHCANYRDNRTCLAFPEGIPDDVWQGGNYHYAPIEGDRGYRYEHKPSSMDADIDGLLEKALNGRRES